MGLRRGFKADANWYARETRRELGLAAYNPLCPWQLADHLGVMVVSLEAYAADHPREVAQLRSAAGRADFSALTLCVGSHRHVIYNDAHLKKRQAADIAHELAHALLNHPPTPPFGPDGSRTYDPVLEDEAKWLGPALLVSDEAALFIAERALTIGEASDRYGASEQVIRMRLNVTGALRRVRRAA